MYRQYRNIRQDKTKKPTKEDFVIYVYIYIYYKTRKTIIDKERTLIRHLVDGRAGQDVKPRVPSRGLGRVAFRGRGEPARMLPRRRGSLANKK